MYQADTRAVQCYLCVIYMRFLGTDVIMHVAFRIDNSPHNHLLFNR